MDDTRSRRSKGMTLMWIRERARRTGTASATSFGMSGKNVGAKELSMNVATIPPGGVAGRIPRGLLK